MGFLLGIDVKQELKVALIIDFYLLTLTIVILYEINKLK